MTRLFFYYSLLSVFCYIMASVIFFYKYGSIDGGIWAALAACVAGLVAYYCKLCIDNRLYTQFTLKSLDYLSILGYMICFVGLGFGVWYFFAILYWKISLTSHRTMVFPCVFSTMTGKWGFHLYRAVKNSINEYMETTLAPLIQNI